MTHIDPGAERRTVWPNLHGNAPRHEQHPVRRATDRIDVNEIFAGGGEMGSLIRAMDWAETPLGPVSTWSLALRMMVRFLLANRFPLLLWWGPRYISIYNDPYRPVLGAKHPWALGKPVSECWSEIWHILQPLIDTPFKGGPATWNDDIALEINRHGFSEETHFTIAYSPVPDDTAPGGIGGVLATVVEITEKVVAERRVVALRDLGARVGDAKTAQEACAIAAQTLAVHTKDIPFALLYVLEANGTRARLAGAAGSATGTDISPLVVDLNAPTPQAWPFAEAIRTQTAQVVRDLRERFASVPAGPWADPPTTGVVMAIPSNRSNEPAGILVAGVSARLRFDQYYHDFLDLVRTQVATAIANARAHEEERRRAAALEAIDRAKTAFFTNVSHEFRTPLTLMLGPTEDLLSGAHGALDAPIRAHLEFMHRNELRLQKLVNALLDFSRIEAGRMQASYECVDLSQLTRELVATFRSAVERAGLQISVHCPPLAEPVYVDREMWEKIVLNILSNALKFTFEGGIEVSLQPLDHRVELSIKDSGVGVPPEEVPRLFERFHRVPGARSRTHEGSGIGLALVQELVKLHGGSIAAESKLGVGTTFTVTIPTGSAHLPQDRIGLAQSAASTAVAAASFVEEALRWLPDEPPGPVAAADAARVVSPTGNGDAKSPERILFADDNADMRDYVRRLLGTLWEVEVVENGAKALASARAQPPRLVLTDVMMPELDGFGLLRELRNDERTRLVPVVMLSARAGEEARIEGLETGADDYLEKPFSARELLARVKTQLELATLRGERVVEMERSIRFGEMFVGMLGHDLRSPLSAIIMSSELLLRREDNERIARPMQRIHTSAERMARMVEQILDFTRARIGGGIPIAPRTLDLAELAEQLVEEIQGAASQPIALVVEGGMQGQWDRDRIGRVISNLLMNAVEHGDPHQPVRLQLDGRDPTTVRFEVWNGGEIAPSLLRILFDPFRTAKTSNTGERSSGLGLGLYIVQQVVHAHGGQVEVHSPRGAGTTVSVALPRTAAARRSPPTET